jgi:hypothetical protein
MLFGLIMYLLGVLTVLGVIGCLILLNIASIDKGGALPF